MTEKFAQLANWVALMSGHPAVFVFAILTVVAWMVTGPVFSYSDTWQLVMNTWTNVATFLMVFLLSLALLGLALTLVPALLALVLRIALLSLALLGLALTLVPALLALVLRIALLFLALLGLPLTICAATPAGENSVAGA